MRDKVLLVSNFVNYLLLDTDVAANGRLLDTLTTGNLYLIGWSVLANRHPFTPNFNIQEQWFYDPSRGHIHTSAFFMPLSCFIIAIPSLDTGKKDPRTHGTGLTTVRVFLIFMTLSSDRKNHTLGC